MRTLLSAPTAQACMRLPISILASALLVGSLVASLVVAPATAAQPVRMSPEQTQRYRAHRLDVEVVETTTYRTTYDVDGARTYPSSRDVDWDGYIGTRRVSEATFYRHAGLDELADRIAGRHTRGSILKYSGIPVFLGGIALIAVGSQDADNDGERDREWLQYVGGGMTLVGVTMTRSGIKILAKQSTSPREAQEAAIRFNTRLGREIVSGER